MQSNYYSTFDRLFCSAIMIFTRGVSLTNFLVASSALGFQAFVLYPWHKRIDEDFEKLKKENLRVLQALQDVGIKEQLNEHRTKR